MKNLFNQINEINEQIKETEALITNTATATYYQVFNRPGEKDRDIKESMQALSKLYSKKYSLLNSLQIECNKELGSVSHKEFKNKIETLKTA